MEVFHKQVLYFDLKHRLPKYCESPPSATSDGDALAAGCSGCALTGAMRPVSQPCLVESILLSGRFRVVHAICLTGVGTLCQPFLLAGWRSCLQVAIGTERRFMQASIEQCIADDWHSTQQTLEHVKAVPGAEGICRSRIAPLSELNVPLWAHLQLRIS